MNETVNVSSKRVKRVGITGVTIGILSILACELPLILAVVGLGSMSGAVKWLSPSPLVEAIGITLGLVGGLLLIGLLVRRLIKKKQMNDTVT